MAASVMQKATAVPSATASARERSESRALSRSRTILTGVFQRWNSGSDSPRSQVATSASVRVPGAKPQAVAVDHGEGMGEGLLVNVGHPAIIHGARRGSGSGFRRGGGGWDGGGRRRDSAGPWPEHGHPRPERDLQPHPDPQRAVLALHHLGHHARPLREVNEPAATYGTRSPNGGRSLRSATDQV